MTRLRCNLFIVDCGAFTILLVCVEVKGRLNHVVVFELVGKVVSSRLEAVVCDDALSYLPI